MPLFVSFLTPTQPFFLHVSIPLLMIRSTSDLYPPPSNDKQILVPSGINQAFSLHSDISPTPRLSPTREPRIASTAATDHELQLKPAKPSFPPLGKKGRNLGWLSLRVQEAMEACETSDVRPCGGVHPSFKDCFASFVRLMRGQ